MIAARDAASSGYVIGQDATAPSLRATVSARTVSGANDEDAKRSTAFVRTTPPTTANPRDLHAASAATRTSEDA